MKSAFLFLLLSSFSLAHAAQVFKCVDSNRSFTVEKGSEGQLFGMFQDSLSEPKRFECEHTRAGNNYKCTSDKNVLVVRRAYSGLMMVDVDDSGYMAAMYCEN
jgi:hypothetical protein